MKSSSSTRTVGSYEAKTHLSSLLVQVVKGHEIVITKRERPIARLVPYSPVVSRKEIFQRLRALRGTLKLAKGESVQDFVKEGRRH